MRLWARVFVLLLWVCGRSDGLSRPIIPNLKLTTLEFYMHDNVTQPATSITVAGPNGTLTGFHFGTINVIDDLITEGPSAYSKVLGRGRGTYAQCSLQIDTVLMSFSAVLDSEKYKGSISFHGAENIFQTTRDVAVVGGTGDFLLAQGFATISSVYFVGPDALLHFKVKIYHLAQPSDLYSSDV